MHWRTSQAGQLKSHLKTLSIRSIMVKTLLFGIMLNLFTRRFQSDILRSIICLGDQHFQGSKNGPETLNSIPEQLGHPGSSVISNQRVSADGFDPKFMTPGAETNLYNSDNSSSPFSFDSSLFYAQTSVDSNSSPNSTLQSDWQQADFPNFNGVIHSCMLVLNWKFMFLLSQIFSGRWKSSPLVWQQKIGYHLWRTLMRFWICTRVKLWYEKADIHYSSNYNPYSKYQFQLQAKNNTVCYHHETGMAFELPKKIRSMIL